MSYLAELRERAGEEHRLHLDAIRWGERMIETLGLHGLLQHTITFNCYPRRRFLEPGFTGNYCLHLDFPIGDKVSVMRYLTYHCTVEQWRKYKYISTAYSDEDTLIVGLEHKDGQNEVQIRFYGPITEGDKVDGCWVVREPETVQEGRLVIACTREEEAA